MKLEICESLILSWLRHVQGCVVAQTNWKPSPTWQVARENELSQLFEAVQNFASQNIGVQIFKKGGFTQFIRQAEVDVLGLRLPDGTGARTVIAVDSAFHEGGLQYGGADETVGRVLKKLIRSAFALEAYVDAGEATVVFATPKMAEPIRQRIESHLEELDALLALAMHRLHFRVIANREFTDEILQPVLDQADAVADTSEVFIRAYQLLNLCEAAPRIRFAQTGCPTRAAPEEGDRIGEHVRQTMRQLAAFDHLSPTVVGKLLDSRYCELQPGAAVFESR